MSIDVAETETEMLMETIYVDNLEYVIQILTPFLKQKPFAKSIIATIGLNGNPRQKMA